MSYFSNALQIVLDRRALSGRRFAELAGMDPTLLNRYVSGAVRPGREMLERLVCALPEPDDRAEIVIAHLRDELPPSARDLVSLQIAAASRLADDPDASAINVKLPKKLLADFKFLMDLSQHQPEVANWVRSMVDVLRSR